MIDIANEFVASGYKVSLVTGRLIQRNTTLHKSIKVDRIIIYNRENITMRLITWFIAVFQIVFKVWFRYKKSYLFIVSNPPMAPLVPLICSNSYSLLIYDVYIEKPEELPLLSSRSYLVRLWKSAHSKVFAKADNIFSLTEGMAATIEKYSKDKKCEIVPLWTDNEFLKPRPHDKNPFIVENNLRNKFIVLYSGSIGANSGVEYLVDVAAITKSEKILFVIIGNGSKKQDIKRKVCELSLTNCIILPWQDADNLPCSLAAANLAVVTLSSESSFDAIPSKLFNYMSIGAPLLCLANPDSDLGRMVITEGIGKCFLPIMKQEIANYIMYLNKHPDAAKMLGEKSLRCSRKYTKENAKKFLKIE